MNVIPDVYQSAAGRIPGFIEKQAGFIEKKPALPRSGKGPE
jgi:hypothetical protein